MTISFNCNYNIKNRYERPYNIRKIDILTMTSRSTCRAVSIVAFNHAHAKKSRPSRQILTNLSDTIRRINIYNWT